MNECSLTSTMKREGVKWAKTLIFLVLWFFAGTDILRDIFLKLK